MRVVTDAAAAIAVLEDPDVRVPDPDVGDAGSLALLRAQVCRFADGPVHARRRALVEAELARLDPDRLRAEAQRLTSGRDVTGVHGVTSDGDVTGAQGVTSERDVTGPDGRRVRAVTTQVLLAQLGATGAVVEDVLLVAPHYLPGTSDPDVNAAVDRLLLAWPEEVRTEVRVARVCILLQACEATAALVASAVPAGSIDAGIRYRPPVPRLRRAGVEIDVAAVQAGGGPILTFGHGQHACPGQAHARALAAGVLAGHLSPAPRAR